MTLSKNSSMLMQFTGTTKDYIADGLVCMWDGIENAGYGKPHDFMLKKNEWVDVTGNGYILDKRTESLDGKWNKFGFLQTYRQTGYNYQTNWNSLLEKTYTMTAVYGKREYDDETDTSTAPMIGSYGSVNGTAWRNLFTERCSDGYNTGTDHIGQTVYLNKSKSVFLTWRLDYEKFIATYQLVNGEQHIVGMKELSTKPDISYVYAQPWLRRLFNLRIYDRILTDDEVNFNYKVDAMRFNLK